MAAAINPLVHVQVQKSASHYTEAARDEITLLTQISDGDPTGSRHCVRLFDWFEHRGPHGLHICMVFEVTALRPAPCFQHCTMLRPRLFSQDGCTGSKQVSTSVV